MATISCFFILVLIFYFDVNLKVNASECCESYTDSNGDWKDEEWCSDYCCDKFTFSWLISQKGDLECCSSFSRRTDYYRRSNTCSNWWAEHAWVPVLISIGCIAAISLCCFGCFKLCSNNNSRTGVMIQQPQAPAVIMMSGHNQAQPQYPYSSVQYPATYPPGAAYPAPPSYEAGMPPPSGVQN